MQYFSYVGEDFPRREVFGSPSDLMALVRLGLTDCIFSKDSQGNISGYVNFTNKSISKVYGRIGHLDRYARKVKTA